MTTIKNDGYPISPLAALVPIASEAEQVALNEDIKENGLREPIVLWKGEIIDGRCRQKACLYAGEKIRIKELDEHLTEEEVSITVKSLNTRRNLTMTQKIISACKVSINPKNNATLTTLAERWAIGEGLLKNARYIANHAPGYIEPLFNGESVLIVDAKGKEVMSNKVSTVYASVKREQEQVVEDDQHGWGVDTHINTQAGKDWYYKFIKTEDIKSAAVKIALTELANYKFEEGN